MFQDFRYSDTERLSRSDEVLKLKNFKKDAILKLFKITYQERSELTMELSSGMRNYCFYAKLGIVHHTSTAQTPQRNGIATACFTQNRSIVHTRYNKSPYELIRRRKLNVQYFHVFGSLCYPTNDRNDLGKMKPKADIGPDLKCSNFQDSSNEMNEIPLHQDLDNLFGPLYEEYYALSTSEVSNNSAANTLGVENTPSPSSIIVEDNDAPQIVTEEPITQELLTLVLETHCDEQIQEDVAELDGNTIMHSFENPKFEEA
ncbi:retrovirus-related pol polyprotein from transposon TNT 1-94 [Tanacetum coccineum]